MRSSRSEFHVRRAVPDDAPQIAPLLADVGFPASSKDITYRLASLTGPADHVFVAATDERLAGIATLHMTPAIHRPAPVGRITLIVVAKEHRGIGMGRALVEACEDRTAAAGGSIIEVISNLRYARAHDFYRHLGYELTSSKFRKDLTLE